MYKVDKQRVLDKTNWDEESLFLCWVRDEQECVIGIESDNGYYCVTKDLESVEDFDIDLYDAVYADEQVDGDFESFEAWRKGADVVVVFCS